MTDPYLTRLPAPIRTVLEQAEARKAEREQQSLEQSRKRADDAVRGLVEALGLEIPDART